MSFLPGSTLYVSHFNITWKLLIIYIPRDANILS